MLDFINIPNRNPRAKKKTWKVYKGEGNQALLGEVRWWEPIQSYMFNMGFQLLVISLSSNDLLEISDFIKKQND